MDFLMEEEREYKNTVEPSYTQDFSDYGQIVCIEFSPFEWSQDILLIAFDNKVLLTHLNFNEACVLDIILEVKHPCQCMAISMSPETTINGLQDCLVFCTSGSDYKLRVFRSLLNDECTCKVLRGHTSFINDVKFDPNNNYLASASDDNTLKLWDAQQLSCITTFDLTTPGISVCWNREDTSKLLVAEKIGIIRLYNVEAQQAILSLDYGTILFSAHWSPSDSQLVASLQLGELLLWDLSKPCQPINKTLLFSEAGGDIKFSPLGELVAAVNNLEGILKIISTKTHQLKFSTNVTIPSNISWHYRFPVVCFGDDNKLCLWKITSK